jgi:hypothetical protein
MASRAAPPPPASTPGSRARRILDRKARFQGWRTTDEEEIERRRSRAAGEPIEIEALEPEEPVFGTWRVGSEGGGLYLVEIRTLSELDNSCDCPDFQVNGLGTCKHVEAVLAHLQQRAAPRPGRGRSATPASVPAGDRSGRVEVFLRRRFDPARVRVQWPVRTASAASAGSAVRALLAPFFRADGQLKGNPLTVLGALARRLAEAPPRARRQVRLSHHLQPWVEERRRLAARDTAKRRFLTDVAAGRRSLDLVRLPLYPYQREGMLYLAFTERALLADEMGLGKTVQAVAACELLRQIRGVERVLVVSPASLKAEWQEQIEKFTGLPVRLIQGPRALRLRQYGPGSFFYLVNYEQVLIDGADLVRLLAPDVIILDEAQRIKNWQTKTAQAVKRLRSQYAFVLTGTPLENRIDELYSIVQFIDPAILGPLFRFNREFYQLDEHGRPEGLRNLGELRRRLRPVLLRRRKDEVEDQLPERTVNSYFVPMEPEQAARYQEYERKVAILVDLARRRPLTPEEFDDLQRWLSCMRMLCDTPYILDSGCRVCPKLPELAEILGERLAEPETKILIFSEWQRMLELVRELAEEMEVGFAWHTGTVPQVRRRQEIRRFKDDPGCRLFLSTDSGGLGLNLQAAQVVINLDLPWNPAKLEQRIARAWRKHQTRPVSVINLVTEESIEHRMVPLLALKQALADGVLDGRGDLDSITLPSGQAAFMARLASIMGDARPLAAAASAATPGAGAPPPIAAAPCEADELMALAAPAKPRATAEPTAPAMPADPAERLRDDIAAEYGDRLLLLELWAEPARAGGTVVAVLDQAGGADRSAIAAALRRNFGETTLPPAVEVLDLASFEAIERLMAAGLLERTAAGHRLLHRAASLQGPAGDERRRRLEQVREFLEPALRRVHMAVVLAGGGFPVEALAPLRDGIETGLRALVLAAEATDEGQATTASREVPMSWIEAHRKRFEDGGLDSAAVQLVARLRGGPETLLGVGEDEARSWVEDGQRLASRIAASLDQAISRLD